MELDDERNTPGIDSHLCKTREEKTVIAGHLRISKHKPDPVKVVWIPKPNGEKRRCWQWIRSGRQKFEAHSFGFWSGQSAIFAAHHIVETRMHHVSRRVNPDWVVDVDIAKCVDTIEHDALLVKIDGISFQQINKRG